jgi:hypothetical protein
MSVTVRGSDADRRRGTGREMVPSVLTGDGTTGLNVDPDAGQHGACSHDLRWAETPYAGSALLWRKRVGAVRPA